MGSMVSADVIKEAELKHKLEENRKIYGRVSYLVKEEWQLK